MDHCHICAIEGCSMDLWCHVDMCHRVEGIKGIEQAIILFSLCQLLMWQRTKLLEYFPRTLWRLDFQGSSSHQFGTSFGFQGALLIHATNPWNCLLIDIWLWSNAYSSTVKRVSELHGLSYKAKRSRDCTSYLFICARCVDEAQNLLVPDILLMNFLFLLSRTLLTEEMLRWPVGAVKQYVSRTDQYRPASRNFSSYTSRVKESVMPRIINNESYRSSLDSDCTVVRTLERIRNFIKSY